MAEAESNLHGQSDSQPDIPLSPNDQLYQRILAGRSTMEKINDPVMRAKMERVQGAMEQVAVGMHDLHALPHDEQIEVLDRVVDTLFEQDPDAQDTLKKITRARDAGKEDEAKGLVAAQRHRYEGIRREMSFLLGVEIEDIEAENEEYRAVLMAKVADLPGASDEEIMKHLGFLVPDTKEPGQYKFAFPAELFPPHIKEKWATYLRAVREHTTAGANFSNRAISNDSAMVEQLDAVRRYAHNTLASSVQEFLRLEDWDFERCRNFIAKMIEQRFPTVQTDESYVTSEAVLRHLRMVKSLGMVVKEVAETDSKVDTVS